MYYNIKIKSNGSEFSLESNNKEVTQREMDLYFAYIFDASKEFKSNIKKIEITSTNVKSIEEIELPKETKKNSTQISDERLHELAKLEAQRIIKAQQLKEKEKIEKEAELESLTFENEIPKNIEEIFQTPNKTIKFQNEPTQIKPNNTQPQVASPMQLQDEIMELINLAQKKFESIENIKTQDITTLNIQEKKENNLQDKNQSIFNDSFQENLAPTPQFLNEEEDTLEISLAELEISLQPQENIQYDNQKEQSQSPFEIIDENSLGNQKAETPEEVLIETPEIKVSKIPLSKIASQIDFKPFLSSFACKELSDEFIICAYFIKNVLKQNDFTMKFINSKLFQATGKIADMSIVDELLIKEYIKTIETEDGKKYCITMDGEGYFAQKFQG